MQSRPQKWVSWHSQHSPGSTLQVYTRVLMSLYAPRAHGCHGEQRESGVEFQAVVSWLTGTLGAGASQDIFLQEQYVLWTAGPSLRSWVNIIFSVLITKELIVEYLLATWAKKVAWERLLLDYIGQQVTRAQLWVGNTRFGSSRNFICLHWGIASGN